MRRSWKFLYLPVIFSAGCIGFHKTPIPPPPPLPPPVLETGIQTAIQKTLDARVLEALQKIAREHVEKSRLLELPGLIYDLPRRLPQLNVENDYRLQTLENAMEACRILTSPAHADLNKIQARTEKLKIAVEQGIRWAKLDYVRRLKEAGIDRENFKDLQRDMRLELSINAGISEEFIVRFDFNCLPVPRELPPLRTPEYIRKILAHYNSAPDAALRFADIVYRLPTELLQRKDCNFQAAFDLVSASGNTVRHQLLHQWARQALEQFQAAGKNLKQNRSAQFFLMREKARLNWRIAYFKMYYFPLKYPDKQDKKEIIFLTDLISLQGK